MNTTTPGVRTFPVAAAAAILLIFGACSGGSATAGGNSAKAAVSGGPDIGEVREKLLRSTNLSVDGLASFVEFREKDRKVQKLGDAEEWKLSYEGVIEFGGRCEYFDKERAKGDRVPFVAEATFVKDAAGEWHSEPMGIYAR